MSRLLSRFFSLLIACFILFTLFPFISLAQCAGLSALISTTESRCAATGTITINASGGMTPQAYQYSISSGPVTTTFSSLSTFSGLPPGTYSVIIKDVTANCSITKSNIVVPGNYVSPGVLYNSTSPTCMNGTDGSIFVTSQTGGRAPFSYQIISPSPNHVGTIASSGIFNGLPAGVYYIQLTDSCGGIQTRTQTVNNFTWSIQNSSGISNSCQRITVNIYLTNSNGVNSPNIAYAGFQYGISRFPGDTTWFASSPFSFDMGTYRGASIVVKDNCGNVQSFSWTEQTPRVNASVNVSNRSCSTFTATVNGQRNLNASFTSYCLYDQTNTILVRACQSSPVFNNIPYGTYTIRTNESCYDTTIIRTVSAIKPLPNISNTVQYNYSCGNFSAEITGQTDTADASYCLYKNGNIVPESCNSTGIFDSLTYGAAYCIKMHNAAVCFDTTITRCFTVNRQKPSLSGSVNTSNNSCSTFTATVSGQTNVNNPIYQLFNSTNTVQIRPNQSSPVFNLLPYGSYCIHMINDTACYDTTIIRCFTEAAQPMSISLSAQGSCSPLGSTNIKVNFDSGIPPFTSMIYFPNGLLANMSSSSGNSYTFNSLPGLPTGDVYKVITTDSCGKRDTATIAPVTYFINRNVTKTSRCPSGTSPNGTSDITFVVNENRGGTFSTTIIKKNGSTFNLAPVRTVNSGNTHTYSFTNLVPATYIFDTYSQRCSIHVYDTIVVGPYVYPTLSNPTGYICDNSSQSINSATVGGLPPFQYQIFGSMPSSPNINTAFQNSPVFTINNGTSYSLIRLRVLDACANASINDVGFISVAAPSININNLCINNPTDIWVDSVPNATYQWYKRTYNPTDSILIYSGSRFKMPYLGLADTGTYIAKTIINAGCEVRASYVTLVPGTVSCLVLPVRLANFNAIKQNNFAILNWTTESELFVTGFSIERSTNNGTTWQSIGQIAALGTPSDKKGYSFIDEHPEAGTNLYRLKVEDKNGNATYSNIIRLLTKENNTVSVFPNPTDEKKILNIQLTGLKIGTYEINIISSLGQTVKRIHWNISNPNSTLITIPTTNIERGRYQVVIKGSDRQYSTSVIVMH